MACGAHGGILASQCLWVEPGAVGVESPPACGRVAGQTVPLGVAGHAALEILARRLTVVEKEVLLGVMIPGAP